MGAGSERGAVRGEGVVATRVGLVCSCAGLAGVSMERLFVPTLLAEGRTGTGAAVPVVLVEAGSLLLGCVGAGLEPGAGTGATASVVLVEAGTLLPYCLY